MNKYEYGPKWINGKVKILSKILKTREKQTAGHSKKEQVNMVGKCGKKCIGRVLQENVWQDGRDGKDRKVTYQMGEGHRGGFVNEFSEKVEGQGK